MGIFLNENNLSPTFCKCLTGFLLFLNGYFVYVKSMHNLDEILSHNDNVKERYKLLNVIWL